MTGAGSDGISKANNPSVSTLSAVAGPTTPAGNASTPNTTALPGHSTSTTTGSDTASSASGAIVGVAVGGGLFVAVAVACAGVALRRTAARDGSTTRQGLAGHTRDGHRASAGSAGALSNPVYLPS